MAKTARQQFIDEAKYHAALTWDAMQLASHHDPDHARELKRLNDEVNALNNMVVIRLALIDRQLERLGAPQYRTIRKGKQ